MMQAAAAAAAATTSNCSHNNNNNNNNLMMNHQLNLKGHYPNISSGHPLNFTSPTPASLNFNSYLAFKTNFKTSSDGANSSQLLQTPAPAFLKQQSSNNTNNHHSSSAAPLIHHHNHNHNHQNPIYNHYNPHYRHHSNHKSIFFNRQRYLDRSSYEFKSINLFFSLLSSTIWSNEL
jgi:hypothetical protein